MTQVETELTQPETPEPNQAVPAIKAVAAPRDTWWSEPISPETVNLLPHLAPHEGQLLLGHHRRQFVLAGMPSHPQKTTWQPMIIQAYRLEGDKWVVDPALSQLDVFAGDDPTQRVQPQSVEFAIEDARARRAQGPGLSLEMTFDLRLLDAARVWQLIVFSENGEVFRQPLYDSDLKVRKIPLTLSVPPGTKWLRAEVRGASRGTSTSLLFERGDGMHLGSTNFVPLDSLMQSIN